MKEVRDEEQVSVHFPEYYFPCFVQDQWSLITTLYPLLRLMQRFLVVEETSCNIANTNWVFTWAGLGLFGPSLAKYSWIDLVANATSFGRAWLGISLDLDMDWTWTRTLLTCLLDYLAWASAQATLHILKFEIPPSVQSPCKPNRAGSRPMSTQQGQLPPPP
jgi:hypothetical protein